MGEQRAARDDGGDARAGASTPRAATTRRRRCATRASGSPRAEDLATQAIWRGVRAKVLARRGRHEEAEALAREAVALVEPTDLLTDQGDALLALAEVLELRGGRAEAAAAAGEALERYGARARRC